MDFVFMATIAGEHIIHNGGALGAKSALAVFTLSNGGGAWVIIAVHGNLVSTSKVL
jgi:hypothetical protein